ncbi:MAG: NAD(+)/NADH kinase [Clostridia bacterium]|nr:NAD(+)/NADH kinase [Clostridia bacterium]
MKVTVIPNPTKDKDYIQTKRLSEILLKRGVETVCAVSSEDMSDSDRLFENADAVIVLGGDGTILCAAEECAARSIPIMGINLGRVGFMTETEQDDMEQAVDALLGGRYRLEERMMMRVTVGAAEYIALNDCVVAKPDAQMIKTAVFADGEQVTEYIADGVIIATPTGSTGYSLSAGGPVADPSTEMFLATPICAHTLKARPAVLAPEKKVSVRLLDGANSRAEVTVDGIVRESLTVGDEVIIQKHVLKLKLIKFGQQSFYDILTAKLL